MAGSAMTAVGDIKQGAAAKRDSEVTAYTLEQNAKQEEAYGQRNAIEARRQARIVESNARAAAAAGGGDTTDPTVVNITNRIGAEGELRAMNALYEGSESARGMRTQADAVRRGGADAMKAGQLQASSTVLSGFSSMYDKYGGKKKYAAPKSGSGYG